MGFQSASERFWQLYSNVAHNAAGHDCLFHPASASRAVRFTASCLSKFSTYREGDIFHWGWIGSHEAYNKLLRKAK
jgi:hypothetical protein